MKNDNKNKLDTEVVPEGKNVLVPKGAACLLVFPGEDEGTFQTGLITVDCEEYFTALLAGFVTTLESQEEKEYYYSAGIAYMQNNKEDFNDDTYGNA